MEATEISINRGMDEAAVCTHDGISLSRKKNTCESVLMRWMNLDPTVQSEVSQKDQYHIPTHTYRIWKKWNVRIYLQGSSGETDMENRLMDMGSGEERVRRAGRVTWKLTSPYVR